MPVRNAGFSPALDRAALPAVPPLIDRLRDARDAQVIDEDTREKPVPTLSFHVYRHDDPRSRSLY